MVRCDEVAAGVADDGHFYLFHGFDDVGAEAVGVGERVARIVDSAVDAAAHVSGSL